MITCCDCVHGINSLEDESIDLVITSPPYNVNLGENKHNKNKYDVYQDNREHGEYIEWLQNVFAAVFHKMVDGGRICINIGDGANGSLPTHSKIINFMEKIGYGVYTTIIWNKCQVGNRCAWGSFNSPSQPSFPTPFEYILVFYKGSKKLLKKGESDLTKEEFIEWSLPIWAFPGEPKMKIHGHPAMFPIELPERLMKMLSYVGATVLDPFSGAGTTGVACAKNDRKFVGFDLSEEYCKIADKRINEVILNG